MKLTDKSWADSFNVTLTVDQKSLGKHAGRLKMACPVCRTHLVVTEDGEYACDWCGAPIGVFAFKARVWTIRTFQSIMSPAPQVLA